MAKRIKIVGLGGSLAEHSSSLAALKIALEAAAEAGAQTQLLDVKTLNLPFYVPHSEVEPPGVHAFCQSIHEADGMLWSSPLYHGTISGAFKNALDWLQLLADRDPPFLTDKVIGLISTAGGTQGLQALNTMEYVVRALRGWAVPLVIPIAQAWKEFDPEGNARHPQVQEQLKVLGREVVRGARQFRSAHLTTPEAEQAEATLQPISDEEVESA